MEKSLKRALIETVLIFAVSLFAAVASAATTDPEKTKAENTLTAPEQQLLLEIMEQTPELTLEEIVAELMPSAEEEWIVYDLCGNLLSEGTSKDELPKNVSFLMVEAGKKYYIDSKF